MMNWRANVSDAINMQSIASQTERALRSKAQTIVNIGLKHTPHHPRHLYAAQQFSSILLPASATAAKTAASASPAASAKRAGRASAAASAAKESRASASTLGRRAALATLAGGAGWSLLPGKENVERLDI
jgi:hypothetical protein